MKIGITERGDAALDLSWIKKLSTVDGAILITKDPSKLENVLINHEIEIDFSELIIHCTITGYGAEILEPNVPSRDKSLTAYRSLFLNLGQRVVLRIDPIIPTSKGIAIAQHVLSQKMYGGRVRISFLDGYNHVRERFAKSGLELPWEGFHAPLDLRIASFLELQSKSDVPVEICGEPSMLCTGCVSAVDLKTLDLNVFDLGKNNQRPACSCLALKTELLTERKQCRHGCLYCYWKQV